ncbi:10665_t:CDS:2 [Entrophospora sp. SA101]|nr:527_t:CDS:2 [Entrophospora sp. SA101]CAJ0768718.1 10665_t:CDS:2 [Entrophospora sp. SA101]
MSKMIIANLLIGFEIQARDPFEFEISNNPFLLNIIDNKDNDNDYIDVNNGCWDNLYIYNENKLSMHLLYANKSFDGQILNLKEYYMGPLYEKCVYDDSIIDNILSVVHIFNKLSDCREGEEGEGSEGNSFDNIILEILNNQLQSPLLATFPSNFSKQSSSLSNRVTNKLPTELNILNSNYNNNELQDQIEEDQIVEEGLNKYIKDLLNKLSISNKIFVCRPTQMNEIGDILSNDMKFNINNDYILLI